MEIGADGFEELDSSSSPNRVRRRWDRLGECGRNGLVAGELGHRHRLSCEGVGRVGIGEAGDTLGGC